MEREVASLLLEQRRLARFNLKLSPDALLRLRRLLYRLGWTRGVPMSRRDKVRRYSGVTTQADFDRQFHNDHTDQTPALVYADWLQEQGKDAHAEIVRSHVASSKQAVGVFAPPQYGSNFQAIAWSPWGTPTIRLTRQSEVDPSKNFSWYATFHDAKTRNDVLSRLSEEGAVVHPEVPEPEQLSRASARRRYERPERYADIGQTQPGHPAARKVSQGGVSSHPKRHWSDQVVEDLRTFRQQVRPKHAMGGPNTVKPNSPEERALLYDHAVQRGLKVRPSDYTYYDHDTHTMYHPNPSDKAAVASAYAQYGEGRIKLRRVVRYAKADTRHEAHPLIAGFPLEHFLRHLANDVNASSQLRDTAKHVLTTGDTSGLWGLHDLLQEHENKDGTTGHPAIAAGYKLMSAADKLHLDKHVYTALHEEGERRRRQEGAGPNDSSPTFTPEHHALIRAYDSHKKSTSREHQGAMKRIRSRVYSLSGEKDNNKIDESIARHAYRAQIVKRKEAGIDPSYDQERAINAPNPQDEREKATRYRRRVCVSSPKKRYARLTLQPGEPLMGGQDFMHEVHDESGNRVGHVWVQPQENGEHLHINHVGMFGHQTNRAKIEGIRQVREQLKAHYPNAKTVGGLRISGAVHANTGGSRETRRPLQRRIVRYAEWRPPVETSSDQEPAPVELGNIGDTTPHGITHSTWGVPLSGGPVPMNPRTGPSSAASHQTFHAKIHDEPDDKVTAGAYADWLSENGQDAAGEIIRGHQQQNDYGTHDVQEQPGNLEPGRFRAVYFGYQQPSIVLSRLSDSTPGRNLSWHMILPDEETGAKLLAGVRAGGGTLNENGNRLADAYEARKQFSRNRVKYANSTKRRSRSAPLYTYMVEGSGREDKPYKTTIIRRRNQIGWPIGASYHEDEVSAHKAGSESAAKLNSLAVQPSKKSRVVKFAKVNRSDFLDALRRLKSSNHTALTDAAQSVAQRMGVGDTKILPALHDTPHGAVPGVAQAVYSDARPETVHALAAWVNGLLPNGPGYAVFHARPTGPDTLYRMRQEGSGMDVRARLDRVGLTSRVLIPHRNGFDVIIPDKGNRLAQNVQAYAQRHGLQVEASPGHFQTVGNVDQSQARATFRDKVVQGERQQLSRRNPKRYTLDLNETIWQGIENSRRRDFGQHGWGGASQDANAGAVLADALDESGQPHAPFFRSLVPDIRGSGDPYRYHTTTGMWDATAQPIKGLTRTVINDVINPRVTWTFRPAESSGGGRGIVVHRRDDAGFHTAVLDAPSLREWASHPKVDPSLRAALVNAAEHLESQQPQQMERKHGVRRYAVVPQPGPKSPSTKPSEEWIKDFQVPVSYDSTAGNVGIASYAPKRESNGQWAWRQIEHYGFVHDHDQAKELFPNVMHEDEFFGKRQFDDGSQQWLTPEEVWIATDGKEGREPASETQRQNIDWRPDETIPEDFYAMRRKRRSLCRL